MLILKNGGLKKLYKSYTIDQRKLANLFEENIFKDIYIQPAAGDAGGSLGAALALWHIELNNPRKVNKSDDMQGSYLGPEYSQKEIEESNEEKKPV